ncbi:helix-turn-helix domain-containing protein [Streptomyces sp. NPDC008150]|uniref:helix-turn-helix domain-containing protein n=1 Tax=Streptomyces sp. NPDC008150 TaxID=3364816 RepID=UPI0036E71183
MNAPMHAGPSPAGGGPDPYTDWDDYLADLGDRVRAERQARGWSQTTFATLAGWHVDQVKRLEAGSPQLRLRNMAVAAHVLGVDLGHLLSRQWVAPVRRPSLTGRQAEVLAAAADGCPLSEVAVRVGLRTQAVASHLSHVYRRLGVTDGVPPGARRRAAVEEARRHHLI